MLNQLLEAGGEGCAAFAAKLCAGAIFIPTCQANLREWRSAFITEFGVRTVLCSTIGATHDDCSGRVSVLVLATSDDH